MKDNVLDVTNHLGMSFPTDEGIHLADVMLKRKDEDWAALTLDLRNLPAGLLISAFFNAFLQRIYEKKPERLKEAKKIQWELVHPFQQENVQEWMTSFKPYDTKPRSKK